MSGKNVSMNVTANIKANVNDVLQAAKQMESSFKNIKVNSKLESRFEAMFSNIFKDIDKLEKKMSMPVGSDAQMKTLVRGAEGVAAQYREINKLAKEAGIDAEKYLPKEVLNRVELATKKTESYSNLQKQLAKETAALTKEKKAQAEAEKKLEALQNTKSRKSIVDLRSELKKIETQKKDYAKQKEGKENTKAYINKMEKYAEEIKRVQAELESALENKNLPTNTALEKSLTKAIADVEKHKAVVDTLSTSTKKTEADLENLGTEIKETFSEFNVAEAEIKDLSATIKRTETDKLSRDFRELDVNMEGLAPTADKLGDNLREMASDFDAASRAANDMSNLKNQMMSFFSIGNAIELFKRTVRSAIETISELDAAMTETAVVTDFSVGDMWSELPRYTKAANELGATTVGAYETMTLYYQQGLQTKEAFEIGTETMKMARIAGMDYAQTTDFMTAALRGFNMELNATSAQRINDVYSELAAISAADTREIASAMTRTASIADSAEMQFETTSAFLSQMIETTREAPENLGTAMKTIIARFQELKKAPSEIMEEVDGEFVDANKIDVALKSIGVSLRDNVTGQFRELDEVFLEISSKWDGMDKNTQRYIATVAAGSRQQSRFIAMMNNYDRTMELVEAANTSAGASQRQFEKTLESMEAKMNKLKNAWNEFAMGILNSDILKFGIDALTGFLGIINGITGALSKLTPGMEGITNSILKIGVAVAGFKGLKGLFNTVFATNNDGFLNNFLKRGKPKSETAEAKKSGVETGEAMAAGVREGMKKMTPELKKSLKNFKGEFKKAFKEQDGNLFEMATIFKNIDKDTESALKKANLKEVVSKVLKREFDSLELEAEGRALAMELVTGFEKTLDKDGFSSAFEELERNIKTNAESLKAAAKNTKGAEDFLKNGPKMKNKDAIDFTKRLNSMSRVTDDASFALYGLADSLSMLGFDATAKTVDVFARSLDAVGMTIMGVTNLFDSLGIKMNTIGSGLKGLGKQYATFGSALKSGGLSNLGTAFSALTTGAKGGLIGAGIVAAIMAIVAAVKFFNKTFNINEKLKQARQAAEDASAAFENARTSLTNFRDKTTEFRGLEDELSGLAIGTAAWNEKLTETNGKALELLESFPQLAQYMQTLSNGQITFDEQGMKEVLAIQEKSLKMTQSAATIASGRVAKLELTKQAKENVAAYGGISETSEESQLRRDINKNTKLAGEAALQSSIKSSVDTILRTGSDAVQQNSEAIGNILTNNFESTSKSIVDDASAMKSTIKEEWAEMSGWTWVEGDTYKNKGTGVEQEFDYDSVKQGWGDMKALEQGAEAAERMVGSLGLANVEMQKIQGVSQRDTFTKLLGNDASISQKDLTELADTEIDSVVDSLAESLDPDELANVLADFLGADVKAVRVSLGDYTNKLKKTLKQNKKNLLELGKQRNADLATAFAKVSLTNTSDSRKSIGEAITKLTEAQKQTMIDTSTALEENLGTGAMQEYLMGAIDIYTNGTKEQMAELEDVFNVDMSNPIEAFAALEKGAKSTDKEIRKISKSVKRAGADSLSAGKQMKYFLSSEEYAGLSEQMNELADSTGKLDANDIVEMAEGSKLLSQMLENAEVGAGGLALAMTSLNAGKIGLNDLTEGVVAAISAFNGLDTVVAEAFKSLDNLDLGRDTGEIADKFGEIAKEATEFYSAGEYGNERLVNTIKYIFGEEQWTKALDAAGGNLQKAQSGFISRLKKVGEEDLGNMWFDLKDNYMQGVKDFSVTADGAGGVLINPMELSTEQLRDRIAEVYKVSKETANAMLADAKNNSAELTQLLQKNDFQVGVKKYVDTNTYQVGGADRFLGSDAEISTIATTTGLDEAEVYRQLGAELGYTKSQLEDIQALKAQMVADGNLIKLFDEEGSRIDATQIIGELDRVLGDGKDWWKNFLTPDTGAIDLGAIQTQLDRLGLTDLESDEAIKKMAEEVGNTPIELDGVKIDTEELAKAPREAMEAAAEDVEYTKIGNAIAEGIISGDYSGAADKIASGVEGAYGEIESGIGSSISEGATAGANKLRTTIAGVRFKVLTVDVKPRMIAADPVQGYGPLQVDAKRAKGSDGLTKDETALVGEEGPELLERLDGTATVIGQKGPEIRRLKKGDKITPAGPTKKIIKGQKTKTMNRYALGTGTTKKKKKSSWWTKLKKKLFSPREKKPSRSSTRNKIVKEKKSTSSNRSGGYGGSSVVNEDTKQTPRRSPTTSGSASAYGGRSSSGGTGGGGTGGGGTGGGGAGGANTPSKEKKEKWSNPFDKFYNIMQRINRETIVRNRLEKNYDRILNNKNSTLKDVVANLESQRNELRKIIKDNTTLKKQKQAEYKKTLDKKKYKGFSKYAKYDEKTNSITIDWAKIKAVKDPEKGQAIEDYIAILEDIQKSVDDATDAIQDAKDRLEEIKEIGKQSKLTLQQKVMGILTESKQKRIDEMQEVADAIGEANDRLLNSINKNLSKMRQDRANQKTEEDIAKKERRLAYLRQDTSNANQVEIARLEQELADERQSYTDTLIDQRIADLEEQNAEAAEARRKQIEIAQKQLDSAIKNGDLWAEVKDLMETGITVDGIVDMNSELGKLLASSDDFKSGSLEYQASILEEIRKLALEINAGEAINGGDDPSGAAKVQLEDMENQMRGETISFTDGNGNTYTGKVSTKGTGNVIFTGKDGKQYYYKGVYSENGVFKTDETTAYDYNPGSTTPTTTTSNKTGKLTALRGIHYADQRLSPEEVKNLQTGLNSLIADGKISGTKLEVDGKYGTLTKSLVKKVQTKLGFKGNNIDGLWGPDTKKAFTNYNAFKGYKTGGLADYTGPAWLDGTPSKPELVLNQKDTENFLQLKDVLSGLKMGSLKDTQKSDTFFDINISVDSLSSDYDVDQMANRIKKIIYQDARYRNNNIINRLR